MICFVCFILLIANVKALHSDSAKYYIDGSALIVFDGNVSDSILNDVLDSTLYSQILASHAYDRFIDFTEWYAINIRILEEVAWTIHSSDFKLYSDAESSSDTEAIKKKVSTEFSGAMKTSIFDALDKLNSNSSLEKFFSHAVSKGNVSNIQILLVSVNYAENIVMSYIGFVINTVSSNLRLLFTTSGLGVLKSKDYLLHRNDVSLVLGSSSKSVIVKFKLC